jgi:anti-sigma regulatory factor (Ser/Thr protein kinase)
MSTLPLFWGTGFRHGRAAERVPATSGDSNASIRQRWHKARQKIGEIVVNLTEDPGARKASWQLPTTGRAASTARRLTRTRLEEWGMAERIDVAELLVSELVTNALRHAPGPVRLTLSTFGDVLRCEVADAGNAMPQMQAATEEDEGGRGLRLIDSLACCWGGRPTPEGKVVWFELASCGDAT